MKTLNGRTCSIPTLEESGTTIDQATCKAEAFIFHSCFNRNCPPLQANISMEQFGTLIPSGCPESYYALKRKYMYKDLTKLVIGKSMGCDGVSAKMLKSTAASILY